MPDSSGRKRPASAPSAAPLIDDLGLTSKLEYGVPNPCARKDLRREPLFRQLVAQFAKPAERCEITLEQEEPAEQTMLPVDEALLARLLENLNNSVRRRNPKAGERCDTPAGRGALLAWMMVVAIRLPFWRRWATAGLPSTLTIANT